MIKLVSKTSPKYNSETNEAEILREKDTSSELRQKIIDDLRLNAGSSWFLKLKRRTFFNNLRLKKWKKKNKLVRKYTKSTN